MNEVDGPDEDGGLEAPQLVEVFRNPLSGRPVVVPHDVAVESERPYRAYYRHLGGMSWEAVADAEGYPNWQAARADVQRYLNEGRSLVKGLKRAQLLEREVARIDLLQSAVWNKAMEGNLPAVSMALSCVTTRVKLLRLDQDIRDDDDSVDNGSVVVPSDDDGYAATLRAAAGMEDEPRASE